MKNPDVGINQQNEVQNKLAENCKYIGKTYSELETLLGELTPKEFYDGAKRFGTKQTDLIYLFPDNNDTIIPESDDYCIAIAGKLNFIVPSMEETISLGQLNEMLNATAKSYESEEYEGYYAFGFIDFIPNYLLTKFAEEINKEIWNDIERLIIYIEPLVEKDEINRGAYFTISIDNGLDELW
jgi:hypothetical protein